MACPPKIWEGKKPSKIFRDFWQLSNLIANISETDRQIENRKSSWSTTTPPTLEKKSPWTLVHKQKSYWRAYRPTQVDIRHHYILAFRGCWPLKFLHALEICCGFAAVLKLNFGFPNLGERWPLWKWAFEVSDGASVTSYRFHYKAIRWLLWFCFRVYFNFFDYRNFGERVSLGFDDGTVG